MSIENIITIATSLAGVFIMFGICKNKIEQNEKNLEELKLDFSKEIQAINNKQNQTDTILQSINNLLASVNSKVDLLIDGKIKTGDDMK